MEDPSGTPHLFSCKTVTRDSGSWLKSEGPEILASGTPVLDLVQGSDDPRVNLEDIADER